MAKVWTDKGMVTAYVYGCYAAEKSATRQAKRMCDKGRNAWVWRTKTGWWNVWVEVKERGEAARKHYAT